MHAVAHVVAQVEADDLGIPVAVAEVPLGKRPEAVARPDRYQLNGTKSIPPRGIALVSHRDERRRHGSVGVDTIH